MKEITNESIGNNIDDNQRNPEPEPRLNNKIPYNPPKAPEKPGQKRKYKFHFFIHRQFPYPVSLSLPLFDRQPIYAFLSTGLRGFLP